MAVTMDYLQRLAQHAASDVTPLDGAPSALISDRKHGFIGADPNGAEKGQLYMLKHTL